MSTSCLPGLRIFFTHVIRVIWKNFCHTFLRNHKSQLLDIWHRASAWELYRVRQFPVCRMSTSCLLELRIFLRHRHHKNFCHTFLRNHRGQLTNIWHRASAWSTVSCKTVSSLLDIHFLFAGT